MKMNDEKIIANNKKARHEYFIEDVYEAGIVLKGTEVKSIRQGKVSVKEAFCQIKNGECFVVGMHISEYDHGNIYNLDPLRDRKLLLNRREIDKLLGKVKENSYTIIPLSVKLKNGLIKLDIGLARGKKLYDKRDVQKLKDAKRQIERALRERY